MSLCYYSVSDISPITFEDRLSNVRLMGREIFPYEEREIERAKEVSLFCRLQQELLLANYWMRYSKGVLQ